MYAWDSYDLPDFLAAHLALWIVIGVVVLAVKLFSWVWLGRPTSPNPASHLPVIRAGGFGLRSRVTPAMLDGGERPCKSSHLPRDRRVGVFSWIPLLPLGR